MKDYTEHYYSHEYAGREPVKQDRGAVLRQKQAPASTFRPHYDNRGQSGYVIVNGSAVKV